jgi:hypothetical protein
LSLDQSGRVGTAHHRGSIEVGDAHPPLPKWQTY